MVKGRTAIHEDILEKLTSEEADLVTPRLCAVYMRLIGTPEGSWEGASRLRFRTAARGGEEVTAWAQLVARARVPEPELRAALAWMEGQGVLTCEDRGDEVCLTFSGLFKLSPAGE